MKKIIYSTLAVAALLSATSCDKLHKLLGEIDFSNENVHNIFVGYDWQKVWEGMGPMYNDPTGGNQNPLPGEITGGDVQINPDWYPFQGGNPNILTGTFALDETMVDVKEVPYYSAFNDGVPFWKQQFFRHIENVHYKGMYRVSSLAGEYGFNEPNSCDDPYWSDPELEKLIGEKQVIINPDYSMISGSLRKAMESPVIQKDDLLVAWGMAVAKCIDAKDSDGNVLEAHEKSNSILDPDEFPQENVVIPMHIVEPVEFTVDNTKTVFKADHTYSLVNYAFVGAMSYSLMLYDGKPNGPAYEVFAGSLHMTRPSFDATTAGPVDPQKGGVSTPFKTFGYIQGETANVFDVYDVYEYNDYVGRFWRKVDVTDQVKGSKAGDKVTIYLPACDKITVDLIIENGMNGNGRRPIVEI
ncbi:MAG: hypothetical protein MJY67_05790 [Bacteroidales bacterium]|nr:hypothetical protein [Bacteroidales bacterium]